MRMDIAQNPHHTRLVESDVTVIAWRVETEIEFLGLRGGKDIVPDIIDVGKIHPCPYPYRKDMRNEFLIPLVYHRPLRLNIGNFRFAAFIRQTFNRDDNTRGRATSNGNRALDCSRSEESPCRGSEVVPKPPRKVRRGMTESAKRSVFSPYSRFPQVGKNKGKSHNCTELSSISRRFAESTKPEKGHTFCCLMITGRQSGDR